MSYKILTNIIAPNQIQHLTGEIVDIEDGELAKGLVERGLVASTESAATHFWTKKASVAAGGLPINAVDVPKAPESSGTSQLNAAKVAAKTTGLPEQPSPVPESPSKDSVAQPTPSEVAAAAAAVS